MANKLISQMGLPKSIANIFAARNMITVKCIDWIPVFLFVFTEPNKRYKINSFGQGQRSRRNLILLCAQVSESNCSQDKNKLTAQKRKSPMQRATYEYLRGNILDVFPEYKKDAEDHLSKAED
ncbi:Uncharacterized protein Fot_21620 [Forsythia ovata]|uniref:Uncharacterized protein n=1 Tax=Forsythia ovata TaxID=205694 RepID=A0ABD1UVC5_9LAMI